MAFGRDPSRLFLLSHIVSAGDTAVFRKVEKSKREFTHMSLVAWKTSRHRGSRMLDCLPWGWALLRANIPLHHSRSCGLWRLNTRSLRVVMLHSVGQPVSGPDLWKAKKTDFSFEGERGREFAAAFNRPCRYDG